MIQPDGCSLLMGAVIRVVNSSGVEDLKAFFDSATSRRFVEQGRLVRTKILDAGTARNLIENSADSAINTNGSVILEHERIPFQSFPYEWPPEMLHAAGQLTLDLAEGLLDEGLGLKDATPYNILFRGSAPVFVDWLSYRAAHSRRSHLAAARSIRAYLSAAAACKQILSNTAGPALECPA